MGSPDEFKVVVPCPAPSELYKHHHAEIVAAASGSAALRGHILAGLRQVFQKVRLTRLEEIPVGDSNAGTELIAMITALLARIKRGETGASMRQSFEMTHDPGPRKRTVFIDIALASARMTVTGVRPVDGTPGFLRDKGWCARVRSPRNAEGKVDHYLTGTFAHVKGGELLAVIDNSKTGGKPGINARGLVVKPERAAKYWLEIGTGVEKKEDAARDRIELYAAGDGMVKSRHDAEGNLRFLAVECSLKLGDIGFRTGGHVMAVGSGGQRETLSIETAEFRSVPPAFEARTDGAIFVRETIQGKVRGASVTADFVNQSPGRFIIATAGAITINRSVQGGFFYAPKIVIGNGRVPATLMNSKMHARNVFVGNDLVLAGRNRIRLGSDAFREHPATGAQGGSYPASGQDLFAGRRLLQLDLREKSAELKESNGEISKGLIAHVNKKMAGKQPLSKDSIRKLLEAVSILERQFASCPPEEEEPLRQRLSNLLLDLGVKDTLPFLQRFARKKQLGNELRQVEASLEAITQDIEMELTIRECKDGAVLVIRCWNDEVFFTCIDQELRIERTATQEQLFSGPKKKRTIFFSFKYETERLACEVSD